MCILTLKEEVILLSILKLGEETHGPLIREKIIELTHKEIVYGTLYNSLDSLIGKGYVTSRKGDPTPERGGKSKTIYSITNEGKIALEKTQDFRRKIWENTPEIKIIKAAK